MRTAIRNNMSAYGFSVMITCSYGVLNTSIGPPSVGNIFMFAGGAVTAVMLIDAIVSSGFRDKLRGDPSDVVALGAALELFSAGAGIGVAAIAGVAFGNWVGWTVGGTSAATAFVLMSGIEMAMARAVQEERDESGAEQGEEEEVEGGAATASD
jgi:ABC-type branched-subunit amino acid transport system permease subunit